jgi:hypothetical protein
LGKKAGSQPESAPYDKSGLLVAVLGSVVIACLRGMMRGVVEMALRRMGMVAGLFVIARIMVFRRCTVMGRGVLVMLRSFAVVLRGFFRHVKFSF